MVSFKTHSARSGEPLGAMKLKGERELAKGHSVHFVDSRGQELLSARAKSDAEETPDANGQADDGADRKDFRVLDKAKKTHENTKGRGRRRGLESSMSLPSRNSTKGRRSQSQPEVQEAWEQAETPPGDSPAEGQEKLFVRRRSVDSLEGEKDRNSAESSRREG
ncbi:uncharacterized protein LOC122255996 [Penaeus japonicus]|uniref:uncharacterized protein LOC122255996 n=1 Tax=Penaeus japonicus TaxID=27405 RepID=UPI001C715CD0|nr:uncharacterized protein LOC122255996 [Penaeus japonicus]